MNYDEYMETVKEVERLLGSGNIKGAMVNAVRLLKSLAPSNDQVFLIPDTFADAVSYGVAFDQPPVVQSDVLETTVEIDRVLVEDIVASSTPELTMTSGEVFSEDGTSLRYEIENDVLDGLSEMGIDAMSEIEAALKAEIKVEVTRNEAIEAPVVTEGTSDAAVEAEGAIEAPVENVVESVDEVVEEKTTKRGGRPKKSGA